MRAILRVSVLVCAVGLIALAGCGATTPASEARILAIGDSVMAFHKSFGASVPDVVADRLGQPVVNRAVSGARISSSLTSNETQQYDIRKQYTPGTWDWVIFNGGANDLLSECGCNRCNGTLDGMISPDARRGDIPVLLVPLAESGTRIVLLGYYDGHALPNMFSGCDAVIERLNERFADLAARYKSIVYVDAGLVMDPADPGLWFVDRVHPSRRGARAIGGLIADAMSDATL